MARAAAAELRHAAHLEVDVLVDVAEQRVERVVQGVGEDERPGNERHAEHDGQRGEGQAQLVREQPLDGHPPHVRSPSVRMRSSTESARRLGQLVDDVAVGQEDDPVGVGRPVGVVGHHDDGLAELGDGSAQERQHLGRGIGVQVPGGLVGEDQVGPVDQGPGTGAALLLATRHLAGPVRQPVADAELVDQVVEPLLVHLPPGQVGRQRDVLARGEGGDEVEGLEHEADVVAPHLGQPGVVEAPDVEVPDEGLPRRRAVEAGHAVHEGRLARPRRAHDRGEATALEGHVDAGQGMDRRLARPVGLAELDRVRRRRGRTLCGGAASVSVTMPRFVDVRWTADSMVPAWLCHARP